MSENKQPTVLVTGGADGIGEGICRRLAADGYKVTVGDINETKGTQLAEEIGGDFIQLDVTSAQNMQAAVETIVGKYGQLNAMVNNAGVLGMECPLGDLEIDEWKRVMSVNLDGVFYGLKYALKQMSEQSGGGNIVNIGSMAGFRGLTNLGAYGPSKWAVRGLTAMAATEYSQKNIRVNSVAPTTTKTAILSQWLETMEDPTPAIEMATSMNALPGLVQPEDIASATAYLLSDEARFITGATIPVDAGALARMANARDLTCVG